MITPLAIGLFGGSQVRVIVKAVAEDETSERDDQMLMDTLYSYSN